MVFKILHPPVNLPPYALLVPQLPFARVWRLAWANMGQMRLNITLDHFFQHVI